MIMQQYDFKAGFGDVTGRYWLGNDQIHELTKDGGYKLRVDLEAYDNIVRTIRFVELGVCPMQLFHF